MLYLLLVYEVEICNEIKGSYFLRTNIGTVVQVTVFVAPFFQYAVSLETDMGVPKLIEGNGQEVPAKKTNEQPTQPNNHPLHLCSVNSP